jgi:hypothetical protein
MYYYGYFSSCSSDLGFFLLYNYKNFLQEKAVEATKQEKERKEEKT